MPGPRHLLFDIGGPVLLRPFEVAVPAASMGVDPAELGGGPFDPHDARWAARARGAITDPIRSLARVRAALDRTGAHRP